MQVEKHMFLDWLAERGSSLACPYCSNDEWNLIIHDPVDLADQRLIDFTMLSKTLAFPVVAMSCTRCSTVRTHATAAVLGIE
ncbi:hypothetical protein FIV34_16495 [Luteibacter pinisoli]|uniref:Uncharacterized protein n=1 Tax=Luteibacter pinisoli TaxID=2589080 RepID=A0A4Y5Z5Y9_9GAMM|nr:hypothetical protein [Luteibacter pinisoli]QDE40691.1 hypothetical protein FIV34_16495 [Luteibacter pinisoli]